MSSDNTEIVKIQSNEDDIRELSLEQVKLSSTIMNLIEDAGTDCPIPLPNVNTRTLDKIIEYLVYHTENPEEHLKYEGTGLDEIGEWDIAYCDAMNNSLLFEVILSSNFMDIQPLLHLTCKTVAKMIKGKKPDEIKEALKIETEENP
jgi:S-phase kinase-associated protein 1